MSKITTKRCKLVKPHLRYRNSFIEAYNATPEWEKPLFLRYIPWQTVIDDFSQFVALLHRQEKGEALPTGKVSRQNYWLVQDAQVLGILVIRPHLTPALFRKGGHMTYAIRGDRRNQGYGKQILQLGIKKAQELDLTELLLTCHISNIASQLIIESKGGYLIDVLDTNRYRYIIDVP